MKNHILSMSRNGKSVTRGSIGVRDHEIVGIRNKTELIKKFGSPDHMIPARKRVVILCLINAHTSQTLPKTLRDGLVLLDWLRTLIHPLAGKLRSNQNRSLVKPR